MRGLRRGFEGWYHKITLPTLSFGFIYSIFDMADESSERHGVDMQLIGPNGQRIERTGTAGNSFWADEHEFAVGHTFYGVNLKRPASPSAFRRFVTDGFQLTATRHQGRFSDGRASWSYTVEPRLGWGGGVADKQYSTAGWLAALPVFSPHYQVLMAHGVATGYIIWQGKRHDFCEVPVYAEKNWGDKFPSRWFWLQCNAWNTAAVPTDGKSTGFNFPSTPLPCQHVAGVVSVTVAGGARGVPVIGEQDVAMIAVHTNIDLGGQTGGFFHPFPNVKWRMGPWGRWRAAGTFKGMRVLVEASCTEDDEVVTVRVPTAVGMVEGSRETFDGRMRVRMWRAPLPPAGSDDATEDAHYEKIEPLIDARSDQAALELGGGPWDDTWVGSCEVNEFAKALLSADVPLEQIADRIPGY